MAKLNLFRFYVSRRSSEISTQKHFLNWFVMVGIYSVRKKSSLFRSPCQFYFCLPKDSQFLPFSTVQNGDEIPQLADKEGWIKIIDFLKFATGTELCKIEFQDRVFSKANFDNDEEKKGPKKDPKLKVILCV